MCDPFQYSSFSLLISIFNFKKYQSNSLIFSVTYEARLEDGTLISKSDGVEFTVEKGRFSLPLEPCVKSLKGVSEIILFCL